MDSNCHERGHQRGSYLKKYKAPVRAGKEPSQSIERQANQQGLALLKGILLMKESFSKKKEEEV